MVRAHHGRERRPGGQQCVERGRAATCAANDAGRWPAHWHVSSSGWSVSTIGVSAAEATAPAASCTHATANSKSLSDHLPTRAADRAGSNVSTPFVNCPVQSPDATRFCWRWRSGPINAEAVRAAGTRQRSCLAIKIARQICSPEAPTRRVFPRHRRGGRRRHAARLAATMLGRQKVPAGQGGDLLATCRSSIGKGGCRQHALKVSGSQMYPSPLHSSHVVPSAWQCAVGQMRSAAPAWSSWSWSSAWSAAHRPRCPASCSASACPPGSSAGPPGTAPAPHRNPDPPERVSPAPCQQQQADRSHGTPPLCPYATSIGVRHACVRAAGAAGFACISIATAPRRVRDHYHRV